MAVTYSLGLTGTKSHTPSTTKVLQVPDSSQTGQGLNYDGGAQACMRLGDQILCKGPDGMQAWYTIDAERSTKGNLILLKVS